MQLRPDGKRHCFESHKGQVAIFLESDPPVGGADPLRRETASFDYDLQLVDEEQDDHHNRSPDPWQGTFTPPPSLLISSHSSYVLINLNFNFNFICRMSTVQ